MRNSISTFLVAGILSFAMLMTGGCAALGGQTAQQVGAYTLNVAQLTSTITVVDPEIANAEKALAKDKGKFTPAEWQQLQQARVNIDAARASVSSIVSGANGAQTVVSLGTLDVVYSNAKAAYEQAKPIIVKHESNLPPAQVVAFKQLDANMKKLAAEYNKVRAGKVKGANVTLMLSNALKIAAAGAQIAVAAGA